MRTVSSRQNPLVRGFRDAAAHPGAEGLVLLDGLHLIRDAREASLPLHIVAVTAHALAHAPDAVTLVQALERDGVDVVEVTEAVMEALSPVRTPSGLTALASLDTVGLDDLANVATPLVVAAVGVQDPGNLGALIRAAEAGGATGIVICGASAHPLAWKTLRGSMGSALRLPVAVVPDVEPVLAFAAANGLTSIATTARDGRDPTDLPLTRPLLLLLGAEGGGLTDDVVAACDARVTIPMQPPVESLNVAVAAALLVYEARRQRLAGRPGAR